MVSENKEYNKALKELIKMGKKSGSLTEKQVVEKTLTLELTDEELDNLYNSIKEEIITGPATIRCFVDNEVREFDIEVTQVDMMSQEINKGLVIKVTDEELLEKTGGIIQGMSGSPIIQNGKLIGAVTHVFVQDSTKGYGIFIENMLKQVNLPEMCG